MYVLFVILPNAATKTFLGCWHFLRGDHDKEEDTTQEIGCQRGPTQESAAEETEASCGWRNKKKRKSAPRKATAAKARPGSVCIREIRRYQLSTDLLIPRTTFHKVVKQIHAELFPSGSGPSSFRYTHTSVEAMQTACEDYLVTLFEDSLLCTLHRNKHTMMPKDMELARKIRREL